MNAAPSMDRFIRVRRAEPCPIVDGLPRCSLGVPIAPSTPDGLRQGVFAEWEWDGVRLVVRNDRYGYFPLFYHVTDDVVMVSDSIARLIALGAPTLLDDAGIAVFLRLQTFVGEDTAFLQIRQLPPGGELVWTPRRHGSTASRPAVRPVAMSRRDAIANYSELFRRSIARRLSLDETREVVMPLSGGQDSRHIFLELAAQGRPPDECVTVARAWSPKLSEDARVAALVSAAAGVPHTVLNAEKDLFSAECSKNRLTSFCSPEHTWILPFADYLATRKTLLFDGIAGDILSAGLFLNAEVLSLHYEGKFEALAERLLGEERVFHSVLNPSFYERVSRDRASARLVKELKRHEGLHNPISQFTFWNRTRRSIAVSPYAILAKVAAVDSPYLDHDLFDFLAGLPVDQIIDRKFHEETIRSTYPRFADIPFSGSGGPLYTRTAPFLTFARKLSRSLPTNRFAINPYLRKRYVAPRLARSVVDPAYALKSSWLMEMVVYFGQLATLVRVRPERNWLGND